MLGEGWSEVAVLYGVGYEVQRRQVERVEQVDTHESCDILVRRDVDVQYSA